MPKGKAFPRLPGFRDFAPEALAEREHLFRTWRSVACRYGFQEYDGPPLEPLELYREKSGDEIVGQLYAFVDKGGREVSLRPEMTPSLARMLGERSRAMAKPIRWFSIPQLFRYERQQRGRLREHFQWNVDIVGEAGTGADTEVLAVAVDALRALGLGPDDFLARISDRRLLSSILDALGVRRTAEVRRDATIGQAEAERDAGIRSAEAKREQEAATFEAETRIAESERGYNVQKAAYDQEVNARQAEAELADELQRAKTQQEIRREEVEIEVVERAKQIELQQQEIQRRERELEATVRKPAEAERYRLETIAEGSISVAEGTIVSVWDSTDATPGAAVSGDEATDGVIDARGFLQALVDIDYDGPIRAEPFNQALNEMEDDDACRVSVEALDKAFGLVG